MENIEIQPTWTNLLPALLRVYKETKDDRVQQEMYLELEKMARAADRYVETLRAVGYQDD